MENRRVLVAAALIEHEGRLLAAQRRHDDRHPLKWEFPGGKVEPGETPREALARELEEELGIEAEIGDEVARYEYRYPKRPPLLLIFFRVTAWSGEMRNRVFERILWERIENLEGYEFLDGDLDFVRRMTRGEFPGLFRR